MQLEPKLVPVHVPETPEAAVLVLHGGGSRNESVAVSPTQLSVLRMIPIANRVSRAGHGRLAVFRLLNSARGWDSKHTPVEDVRWAVDRIAERLGREVPLGLVGHSLGGRAAIGSCDQPAVHGVVALAPWVYPDDGRVDASGVRVLIVHGTDDRIASPQRSHEAADQLRRTAKSLSFVDVEGGKHAMLAKHGEFSSLAADFSAAVLLDPPPGRAARVVDELSSGSR